MDTERTCKTLHRLELGIRPGTLELRDIKATHCAIMLPSLCGVESKIRLTHGCMMVV